MKGIAELVGSIKTYGTPILALINYDKDSATIEIALDGLYNDHSCLNGAECDNKIYYATKALGD